MPEIPDLNLLKSPRKGRKYISRGSKSNPKQKTQSSQADPPEKNEIESGDTPKFAKNENQSSVMNIDALDTFDSLPRDPEDREQAQGSTKQDTQSSNIDSLPQGDSDKGSQLIVLASRDGSSVFSASGPATPLPLPTLQTKLGNPLFLSNPSNYNNNKNNNIITIFIYVLRREHNTYINNILA